MRSTLPAALLTVFAVMAASVVLPAQAQGVSDPSAGPQLLRGAIGQVLRNGKGPCSGVLVSPRTVLTVGHCVARKSPWQAAPARVLTVRLNGRDHAVASIRIAERSPFNEKGAVGDLRHDWAILTLADNAAEHPLPFAGIDGVRAAMALDLPISKIGWRGGKPVADHACRIMEIEGSGRLFSFRCGSHAGAGRSGSAILLPDDDGYRVIGVQSAEARTAAATVGIAVTGFEDLHH